MHIPVLTSASDGSRCRIISGFIDAWVPDCTPLVTALPDVIAARRHKRRRPACRGSTQSDQQGAQPAAGSTRHSQAEAEAEATKTSFCALFNAVLGLAPMWCIREWRPYVALARLADTHCAIASVTGGARCGSEAAFSCASPRCFHRPQACRWFSNGARMTAVPNERHELPIALDAQRRGGQRLICPSSEPADHRNAATAQDTFSILNFSSDDRIPRRRRSRRLPLRRAAFNQD